MKNLAALVTVVVVGTSCAANGSDAVGTSEASSPSEVASGLTVDTANPDAETHGAAVVSQLVEWVGVELNGLGNGDINGTYPSFVIDSVDVEQDRVSMSGSDGCNRWSATGTIADGRFEFDDGESSLVDCGPGTFGVRDGDAVVVSDDGIDIVRDDVVYAFGPGEVVADALTLVDQRRFIEVSRDGPFPASIEFDGAVVSGFDGCDVFDATAEYGATSVELLDVEASCSTDARLADGDVVEHVGSNTIEISRDQTIVLDSLVAVEESFVPPTTEWLIGEWLVGSGRVTFDEQRVTLGRCDAAWQRSDDLIEVDPWGDCLTGLFPGDPVAEQTLRTTLESPLVHRLLPPTFDDDLVENAAILDAGDRSVRMVRVEATQPSSPSRIFALDSIDGIPYVNAVVPTILTIGRTIDFVRGYDGCGEYSVRGTGDSSSLSVDELLPNSQCNTASNVSSFAPAPGTTITVDDGVLTAIDADGRTGTYIEISALDAALVSDVLDPTTGTAEWNVDGLTVELTGLPGTTPMRIGSCERSWSFDPVDDESIGFGRLRIEANDEPITGCAGPTPTLEAVGLLNLLARTANGDGADIRLASDESTFLIWDVLVIRLDR